MGMRAAEQNQTHTVAGAPPRARRPGANPASCSLQMQDSSSHHHAHAPCCSHSEHGEHGEQGEHNRRHDPPAAPGGRWVCPMCPEVESDRPGPCPRCGMALEPAMPAAAATLWTCPMHPEIVRDRPGTCPICG